MSAGDWVEIPLEDRRNKRAKANRPFGSAPWTPGEDNLDLLEAVAAVRNNERALAAADRRAWRGLGPRQYAYRVKATGFAFADGLVFDKEHFERVERVLTRARRAGYIDWDDVTDGRGTFDVPQFYADNDERVEALAAAVPEMSHDLLAGQPVVPELFVETEGLWNLVYDVAARYGVRSMTAGGQSSVDLRWRLAERILKRAHDDISTVVIALADYDTHGDAILAAVAADTAAHLRRYNADAYLEVVQVALTPAMIAHLGLPTVTKVVNGVSRQVQEVEAVPTTVLRNELQEAIEECLDMDEFERVAEEKAPELERLERAVLGLRGAT